MKRTAGLGALVLLVAALEACGALDPCGNEVMSRALSPDAKWQAVVFERGCGATTGYSTQVSVLPAQREFRSRPTRFTATERGNTFIADQGGRRPANWKGGGPWVAVAWRSMDRPQLVIAYDRGARVSLRGQPEADVEIVYSPSPVAE